MSARAPKPDTLLTGLLRRGFWSFGLNAVLLVLQLAITTILARTLGADRFGTYSFALAAITLVAIPAQFGLPNLVLRETASAVALGEWVRLRGLWRWASLVAVVISGVVAGLTLLLLVLDLVDLDAAERSTLLVGLLLVPLIALGNLRGAALRGLGHVVLGQVPESVVRPLMFVVFLLAMVAIPGAAELSPSRAMGLNVLACAIAFLLGLIWLRRRTPAEFRAHRQRRYESRTWFSSLLILGGLAAAQIVIRNTDLLMLGIVADPEDVGVYKVVSQSAMVISFALSAANLAIAPQVTHLWELAEKAKLQRILTLSARWILVFAVPVTAGFVVLGGRLLGLVFGAEYQAGDDALKILAVGQLFNSTFGSVGLLLNMTRHESETLRGVIVGAVVNVVLNAALIPAFGVNGAATATAVSIVVWNIMLWRSARRRLGLDSSAFGLWSRTE